MFVITVFGLLPGQDGVSIKVTQETTAAETLHQAYNKSSIQDVKLEDYVLMEEVNKGWDKRSAVEKGTTQRILDMGEKVLLAQNKWEGNGKFVIRKKSNDPSTRAWLTTMAKEQIRRRQCGSADGADWEADQQMFLVCIHNVSAEQPYAILQAPVSSTAQDIITQAMIKARRQDDPANYVLVEEMTTTCVLQNTGSKHARTHTKKETKVLADDDNVYAVQSAWKSNAGNLIMMEREKAKDEQLKRERHKPLQRLNFIRFSSKDRASQKKPKLSDNEESPTHRPTRLHSNARVTTSAPNYRQKVAPYYDSPPRKSEHHRRRIKPTISGSGTNRTIVQENVTSC